MEYSSIELKKLNVFGDSMKHKGVSDCQKFYDNEDGNDINMT